jgi:plastocyanin
MKTGISLAVSFLLLFSMLSACAGRQPVITIDRVDDQLTLVMKAGNFEFVPAHVRVPRGTEILLRVENTTGNRHNFTIKDPGGRIIQSLPLPPNGTMAVKLTLGEPGKYHFYCDKPFHSTLGMSGTIEVMSEDKGMSGGADRL